MKIRLLVVLSVFFVVACTHTGVEKKVEVEEDEEVKELFSTDADTADVKEEKQNDELAKIDTILNEKRFPNGLRISWIKKGTGQQVANNDLVRIAYQNCLEDGTVYDANAMIKKTSIPFMVGWNLQTPGWDFALVELHEGDEVEVFIPSELARGEKGIPGIVPPNANNILKLKVIEVMEPTKVVDDIRIWVVEQRKTPGDSIQYGSKVALHYWVSSSSKPRYDNSYQRGDAFELVMGDGNIVPGLYKALHFLREGDKAMIHIPAKEAYGSKGLTNLVKPNEDLFYDLMVVSVK